MSLVTISDVRYLEPDAEALAGFWLDRPAAGTESNVYAINFEGWALGRQVPAAAIEVSGSGVEGVRLPIGFPRPDVATLHGQFSWAERSGFRVGMTALGLPREFELLLSVILEGGRTLPTARLRGRRDLLSTPESDSDVQPLLVTTMGRCGSTWVIELLSSHPQIITAPPWRGEVKAASYWAEILLMLAGPASYLQPVTSWQMADEWWIGKGRLFDDLPEDPEVEQLLGVTQVEEAASFCRQRLDAFYRQVADLQGKEGSRYFAEKCLPRSPAYVQVLRELYPGIKEIFLVRDFRDMLCSVFAFNERLGESSFGRERVESDEEYVRGFVSRNLRVLTQGWDQRSDSAFLLRYEDLVLEPENTLRSLFAYLELDHAGDVLESMLAGSQDGSSQRGHGTSPSARDSIGRWKAELDPELRPVCEESFGQALATFGYSD